MKNKILYVFFVVAALMCCFVFSASAGYEIDEDKILELDKVESLDECFSAGDADASGSTTASDARLILRVSVNLDNIDASNFLNSDVDGDGKLTAADARIALRLSVGLEEYPDHKIVDITIIPATCSTDGLSVKLCTSCIKLYAVFETPSSEHVGCGKWETTVKATCLQEGTAQMKCLFCDEVVKETTIAKTGHSGAWEYPDGKSCLDPVRKIRTCEVCQAVEELTENPPGAHNFFWETKTPNTCTEDGLDVYKCKHCGQESSSQVTKAHGHLYERSIVTAKATCTEEGTKADVCVFCQDTQNESTIPALGHNFDNAHYRVTKEPTCAETGTADVVCTSCGEAREMILEKTEHILTEEWSIKTAPTCTEKGIENAVCRYCGPVTRDIEALGHTVSSWVNVKPATCAEEGIKQGICSVCGDEAVEEKIPTLEHTFNEKENGKAVIHHTEGVLCKEDGRGYILCTVCGYKKFGTIKSLGKCQKGGTETVTAATCTTDAKTVDICTYCKEEIAGSEKTVKNSKLGHDFGEWTNTKEATCAETGENTRTCSRCSETETEIIPSAGHQLGDWVTVTEATCTTEGYSTHSCSVCKLIIEKKTTAKLPHTAGETVIETPATATSDGTCSVYCSECNEKYETYSYTRIAVYGGFEVEFAPGTDVASGSTVSFTVKDLPGNATVLAECTLEDDVSTFIVSEFDGVLSFEIPEDIPETATISITIIA